MDTDYQSELFRTSTDCLPYELLELTLKHLDIKSLIKCRVVSKKWKSVIEQLKIEELHIKYERSTWYFPKLCDRIDAKNSVENFDARRIGTFPLNLSNLKRLSVDSQRNRSEREWQSIYVHDVNRFTQLEQLSLECVYVVAWRENRILRLPKLKTLDLMWFDDGLTVDAPCLKSLNAFELHTVNLVDPKTVEVIRAHSIEDADDVLALYVGVTQLKLDNVLILALLAHENILQSLPNLQMFDGDVHTKFRSNRVVYEQVKKVYNRLLKQKEKLRRDGLKICFRQIEIENGKRFEDYSEFRDYFDC